MIDTETARTNNIRAVLLKRKITSHFPSIVYSEKERDKPEFVEVRKEAIYELGAVDRLLQDK